MKKVFTFTVLVMVFVSACVAQSASSDAQRLVGTWTDEEGDTWVFNADGTGSVAGDNFIYGVSVKGDIFLSLLGYQIDYFFSPDGKRLILDFPNTVFVLQKK